MKDNIIGIFTQMAEVTKPSMGAPYRFAGLLFAGIFI